MAEVTLDLHHNQDKFSSDKLSPIHWAGLYEQDFKNCLGLFFILTDTVDELKNMALAQNKVTALGEFSLGIDSKLDEIYESLQGEDQKDMLSGTFALSMLMMRSMRCLMVYGHYINDLIKITRETKNQKLADKSLLNAIKIDPSVVSCQTAMIRISRAVMFSDAVFLKKLKNAITGKLGIREAKNFQKMRFILQVLHESGGVDLNDNALKALFVEQLGLYSDAQSTSDKNVKEFAYNFNKQKSTI